MWDTLTNILYLGNPTKDQPLSWQYDQPTSFFLAIQKTNLYLGNLTNEASNSASSTTHHHGLPLLHREVRDYDMMTTTTIMMIISKKTKYR